MKLDLSALSHAEYGDPAVLKLDDGRLLRCSVEIDQDTHVEDEEFYGTFAWVRKDRDYVGSYHTTRPEGFDGNAEVLVNEDHARLWWQPPTGDYALSHGRGTPEFDEFRRLVLDLLEYGYKGVTLELCDGTDAYGRPVVRDVASLWGIDSLDNGYLEQVVSGLAEELDI